MSKLKVSVVGAGHLGSIHTKLWSLNPNVELVGIFDVDKEKSNKISNDYNCTNFNSIEEVIENSDATTIAVPTIYHWEVAKQCIQSGKHCLIEKPITNTYQESIDLIESAKKNKVLIQVGHVERFNPAIKAIKAYNINPLFIEAHRLSQFKPRALDVSVIHDLMIHDIDIILWLAKSKITNIDANGVSVLSDSIDIANARLKFENGLTANITASRISANPMRKMRIFQKDAYISLDFQEQNVEIYKIYDEGLNSTDGVPAMMLGSIDTGSNNRNIYFEKPHIDKINAIAEEQNAFVAAIQDNIPIAVNANEASEALRVAEEIVKIIG
ncbi:MAG TPA: Gfo/Idh/MocA family oxidoreductase [Candidatus Kapabacteria bacterium]|nr:Gfo/Idh/MocA family oxidoreductase [Candidatus Kapabacteria bacterium]